MKKILRPIYKLLFRSLRYSDYFSSFQNIFKYNRKEIMLQNVMDYVRLSKLKGDYLEFGVYRGDNFISAYHFARWKKIDIDFYAFDSFSGLPEIKGVDKDSYFKERQYSCSLDKFKRNLRRKGVKLDKVNITVGWFDKVLNKEKKKELPIKKASIIWVDCDLYESTTPILDFITDYIQDGTIIVFDDWFCFKGDKNKGEQKAFNEWLKKNPSLEATEFHKFGCMGNSFIINTKSVLLGRFFKSLSSITIK